MHDACKIGDFDRPPTWERCSWVTLQPYSLRNLLAKLGEVSQICLSPLVLHTCGERKADLADVARWYVTSQHVALCSWVTLKPYSLFNLLAKLGEVGQMHFTPSQGG